MRRITWTTIVPALLLCAIGAFLSGNLVLRHVGVKAGGLAALLCGGEEETGCDAVLDSRWAVFPPAPAEQPDAEAEPARIVEQASVEEESTAPRGVPSALLGLCYFLLLGSWLAAVGSPAWQQRQWHRLPLSVSAAGCAMSAWFIYVMATLINEWCILCLATHLINFVLLALIFLARPRRPAELSARSQAPAAHPSPRLAASALALGVALCALAWYAAADTASRLEKERLAERLDELQGDTDVVAWLHRKQERQTIPVRPDDPVVRAEPGARVQLVVFTDLHCTHCRTFEKKLLEEYLPMFNGHLEFTFKHFPLCKECNGHVARNTHPLACEAAYLAEAARLQGGADAFLKMKRLVTEPRSKPWSPSEILAMAKLAGLDPARLETDRHSEAVRARVREDIELAKSLKVPGTPTVFLNGRLMDHVARNMPGFWKLAARNFAGDVPAQQPAPSALAGRDGAPPSGASSNSRPVLAAAGSSPKPAPQAEARFVRYAELLVAKYDTDKNGVLKSDEWSKMPGRPKSYDINGDNLLTGNEVALHLSSAITHGAANSATRPEQTPTLAPVVAARPPAAGTASAQPLSNVQIGQELDIAGPIRDGTTVDVKDMRGKLALVVFWTSWCGVCEREIPALTEIYNRHHKDGFEIIGVSCDKTAKELDDFVKKYQVPWRQIYFDTDTQRGSDNPLCVKYAVRAFPSTFLLDREGKVISMHLRGSRLEVAVANLLGKKPAVAENLASSPNVRKPPKRSTVEIGQQLEIAGPTLDGKTVSLAQMRGKVTLVIFWAGWCGFCKREIPNVVEVYDRHHDEGFEVLGINSDNTREAFESFAKEQHISWSDIFFDVDGLRGNSNPLRLKYQVRGIPHMFLVDREGKVADLDVRGPKLEPAVAKLLGKQPATSERVATQEKSM